MIELLEAPARVTSVNNSEHVWQVSRALSRSMQPRTIEIPLSNGEAFHANGQLTKIPRGEVDTFFRPKTGTVNRTVVEPPVPARVPMRSIRVPKGVGAIVVIDWARFVATHAYNALKPLLEFLSEVARRATALQDLELANKTAAATQFKPQEAAQRLRSRCLTRTRTATGAPRRSTIIRAFSRS